MRSLNHIKNQILVSAKKNSEFRQALITASHRHKGSSNEPLTKWFIARAAKRKGIVQINMIEQAFDQMKGWSIVPTTTYLILNGNYDLQEFFLNTLMGQIGASRFSRSLGVKEPINMMFKTKEEAEKGIDKFKRIVNTKSSAKAKTPSGQAQDRQLYSSEPGSPHVSKYETSWTVEIPRLWLGISGWHIVSANNKNIDLPHPMSLRGVLKDPNRLEKFNKFWTWTYKNGLAESAQSVLDSLGADEVEMASATKSQQQKLTQQRIMLPEVRKLLRDLTQKQYQEFMDSLVERYIRVLKEAIDAQKDTHDSKKRFSLYNWAKKNSPSFYDFLEAATEEIRYSGVRTRRGNYLDIAKVYSKRLADSIRETFVGKNGLKLSLIVKAKGNLLQAKVLRMNSGADYGGEISFTFKDGSRFIVRNKTVFKWSILGKPFAQYPTTFHQVVLSNGKKMSQPSEKRMVEVFAVV